MISELSDSGADSPATGGGATIVKKRRPILSLHPRELTLLVEQAGGKAFLAGSIRKWILERGVDDFTKMSDLPKAVASRLSELAVPLESQILQKRTAPDTTVKLLLQLSDGQTIETVWMPGDSGGTVCISTQVGCAMACRFCASGLNGVVRNLQKHEILEQLVRARQVAPFGRVVVMGIGEPALNMDNVFAALEVATSPDGLGISARKITISTIGLPDKIVAFAKENKPYNLAISLHAPTDAQRHQLIPTSKKVSIRDLIGAAHYYFEKTGREVTFEYVLLRNVNDLPAHARELARVLHGVRGTVNLIPYNPIPGSPYDRPTEDSARAFREILRKLGLVATIRWSKGVEADAACGQLRISAAESGKAPSPAAVAAATKNKIQRKK